MLDSENYNKGFLIDDEWMAGVSEDSKRPGEFTAFILCHTTGEYVGCEVFNGLDLALSSINRIQRSWKFEESGGCGGDCEDGGCGKGSCKQSCQKTGVCEHDA